MKIILVATDNRGKNLVFVSDTLRAYSLSEAVNLAREGKIENVYPVKKKTGVYLRSSQATPAKEQLDRLSISSHRLFSLADSVNYAGTTPAVGDYLRLYAGVLVRHEPYIRMKGRPDVAKKVVKTKLQPHRELIFAAAKKFDVDPYLLGAIIIDEIVRMNPFENTANKLATFFVGKNTSAGVAQVKMETARGLIMAGYYNPDPKDNKLSPENIQKTSRAYLYAYVQEPKHSISFAAARMRALTDEWKRFVDLRKRPEIIATLYHLGHKNPRMHPEPNDRGLQITNEFSLLAKEWLH